MSRVGRAFSWILALLILAGAAGAAACFFFFDCGWFTRDEPVQWRIALEEPRGGVQYEYATRFAQEIESRTDGEVEVSIYPFGALGDLEDIYTQLRNGAVHLAFGSEELHRVVPETQLFHLHFVFGRDGYRNIRALNDPDFLRGSSLQSAYRDRNLRLLSLVPEGWQVWASGTRVVDPDDWSGVRMRTTDARTPRETYRAYGAAPVALSLFDVHDALAANRIDAFEQPLFAHEEMRFHEVRRRLTSPRAALLVASFMASDRFFTRLPDARQDLLREIADDLVDEAHELQRDLNRQALARMVDETGVRHRELDEDEREAFRDLARPVRAIFASDVGPRGEQLLDELFDAFERAEETIQAEEEAAEDEE